MSEPAQAGSRLAGDQSTRHTAFMSENLNSVSFLVKKLRFCFLARKDPSLLPWLAIGLVAIRYFCHYACALAHAFDVRTPHIEMLQAAAPDK